MTIERKNKSAHMSQAVIVDKLAFFSGQVGTPETDDIEAHVWSVLGKVDNLLEEIGSDRSHILQVTVWLADMADFGSMNTIWEQWIDADNPPARTTGCVTLAEPELKIEVSVVAAVK